MGSSGARGSVAIVCRTMPMKSKAQRRKFAELLVKGEISEEVYERWNKETGRKELPERVTPKAKKKASTAKRKKTTASAKKRTVVRKTAKKR